MKVKTCATLSSEFLEREMQIRDAKDGKILERYAEPGRADPMD